MPPIVALAAEAAFFLALAFGLWARVPAHWLPGALVGAGLLPYLLLPQAHDDWWRLLTLVLIPAVWFAVLPRAKALDLLFVALMAAVYLSDALDRLYLAPKSEFLGKAMWYRTGMIAVLYVAREPGIGFGFWPSKKEWRIGAREFLLFLPVGLAIGFALGSLKWPVNPNWGKQALAGAGMFFGSLWFVALCEEFFFRGLLQRWLGLPLAAVLFGLAHLPFRGFPNWKHAILTVALGVFCGRAFRDAGSIRAPMVTHSLVNALWVGVFGKI